ncbi:hypothetical protein EG329_011947 [Mollisiaceae sp. DMI_Dod_QoI]|nr:hypothetical protein EG329_011947 [Helotiales sp. DMI_Dod_QoI]
MSFGFSVGDFLAVGTLIADISRCLADSGGSKDDYQELLRELESLQHALKHLDKLQIDDSSSANLDSIKYAALSCRRPLENFLSKIKKYDKALGMWSKEGRLKSAANKVRWAYGQKDEIRKLQGYLNIHVGTINILLAEHGLEMMNLASEKVEADHLRIRERLDDTRSIVNWIKDSVSAQATAVKFTNSMLSRVFDVITGDFRLSFKSLETMVEKVCVSTQQIYGVVLEIKGSLALGDTRWTFFQAPLLVEDALGFRFPVPSEYDYALLDTIIRHRFLDGPGSFDVELGNYELFKTNDSKKVLSSKERLLPGTSITMAILVSKPELTDDICPMPLCRSNRSTAVLGGGRRCCECDVWFDRSTKTRKSFQNLWDAIDERSSEPGSRKRKSDQDPAPRKRAKHTNVEGFDSFKNVRWTVDVGSFEDRADSSGFEFPVGGPNFANPDSNSSLSIPESHPYYQPSAVDTAQTPILNDALHYLDQIKVEFQDQPEKYNLFLDVMKAFKAVELDTPGVIDHIHFLFAGREALLQGFNLFLPPGWSISPQTPPNPNFVWKVAMDDDEHRIGIRWQQNLAEVEELHWTDTDESELDESEPEEFVPEELELASEPAGSELNGDS